MVSQCPTWDGIGVCLVDPLEQLTHSVAVYKDVTVAVAPRGTLDAVDCKCGHGAARLAMWELFGIYGRIQRMEAANTREEPMGNIQSVVADAEATDVEASLGIHASRGECVRGSLALGCQRAQGR